MMAGGQFSCKVWWLQRQLNTLRRVCNNKITARFFSWMIKGRDCSKTQQLHSTITTPVQPHAAEHTGLLRHFSQCGIGWKLCHIAHLPVTDYSPWYSVFPSHISSFKCKIWSFAFPKPETMTQEELELTNHLLSISHYLLIDWKTR